MVNARICGLVYRLNDVGVESGFHMFFRTEGDLFQVQRHATNQQEFQEAVGGSPNRPRLSTFLLKKLVTTSLGAPHTARRALFLIYVCAWEIRRNHPTGSVPLLFLERFPWLDGVLPIAVDQGVSIIEISQSPRPGMLRRLLPMELVNLLRFLRHRRFQGAKSLLIRKWLERSKAPDPSPDNDGSGASPERIPIANYLVAVEYVGLLNLNYPERHSNLFFWQQSSLAGSDLMVIFTASNIPLDELTQADLNEHYVSAVATHHGATNLASAPVFSGPRSLRRDDRHKQEFGRGALESKWLNEQLSEYLRIRDYWAALYEAQAIRIDVSYNKSEPANFARADALESLGGITVNYERTHHSYPRLDLVGSADVMFNYSQSSADLEIESGSATKYHVVAGYLGDHRFPMLQDSARGIRDSLRRQGAKHILAFFDEGSVDDPRWNTIDHQMMQENYTFLLDKVVTEPWFGLVIKPKTPSTLRRRLGPVNGLLEQAEATGRCYLFEGGRISGWNPPAAAALAADLAVHGHLRSSTAGLEAALAGVPTLLLDREGWQVDPLYRLGVGRVIFKDWEGLWEACTQHWASPEGIPGFGDWSSMLDEFDPFRDGRAAERMGTYIKWLLEGLRAGLDRETAMAETAERYCAVWGHDKVIVTNPRPESQMAATSHAASRVTAGG